MSLFGRKPNATPSPAPDPAKGPVAPPRAQRHTDLSVPHSRQAEHAIEVPRGVDTTFCYSDEQDS